MHVEKRWGWRKESQPSLLVVSPLRRSVANDDQEFQKIVRDGVEHFEDLHGVREGSD